MGPKIWAVVTGQLTGSSIDLAWFSSLSNGLFLNIDNMKAACNKGDDAKSSSSPMCVMNHNWSATKQRLHLQSVAMMSRHSVLSAGLACGDQRRLTEKW